MVQQLRSASELKVFPVHDSQVTETEIPPQTVVTLDHIAAWSCAPLTSWLTYQLLEIYCVHLASNL